MVLCCLWMTKSYKRGRKLFSTFPLLLSHCHPRNSGCRFPRKYFTYKEATYPCWLFLLYLTLRVFSGSVSLITALVTTTISTKGFFFCCRCTYCEKNLQEDLPDNCDWVSETQSIIQEWMAEIVSKFIFLYLRDWLWTSFTRSEEKSGI